MTAVELVAGDLTVAIWFGAITAVLVGIAAVFVGVVVDAIGEGDAVGDVERFLELSAAGRYSLLPDRPLLSDPDGEASEMIDELLARKERASRALWASRDAIESPAPAVEQTLEQAA